MDAWMEWNGMEWNGMQWNGMDWTGVEWSGMEWDGVGWNGMDWTGVEWNGMEGKDGRMDGRTEGWMDGCLCICRTPKSDDHVAQPNPCDQDSGIASSQICWLGASKSAFQAGTAVVEVSELLRAPGLLAVVFLDPGVACHTGKLPSNTGRWTLEATHAHCGYDHHTLMAQPASVEVKWSQESTQPCRVRWGVSISSTRLQVSKRRGEGADTIQQKFNRTSLSVWAGINSAIAKAAA